jgi:hypothetical protein
MPNVGRLLGVSSLSALSMGGLLVAAGYTASGAPHYTCVTADGVQYRTGPGLRYPTAGLTYRGQRFTEADGIADTKEQITWTGGTLQGPGPEVWIDSAYLGPC